MCVCVCARACVCVCVFVVWSYCREGSRFLGGPLWFVFSCFRDMGTVRVLREAFGIVLFV